MWLTTKLIAMPQGVDCDGFSTFDVPIFTEEFLDQNKGEILVGPIVLVGGSRKCECGSQYWKVERPGMVEDGE